MGKKSKEKKMRQSAEYQEVQKVRPQNQSFSFLKIIILGGTLLALFAPLLVADRSFFPYVGGKSMYFMAFAEVVFFAWLALMSFRPEYRPRKSVLLIALGLLLASMAISTAFGVDPSRSFWSKHERVTGLLMWLHLFGFFIAISSTFKRKDWLWVFGFSNFVGIIVGLNAMFVLTSSAKEGGTLGNESFLGTYILLNSFLAIYLFFFKFKNGDGAPSWLKKSIKIFAVLSLLVFSFVLLFEGSQFWLNFMAGKPNDVSLFGLAKDVLVSGARAAKYCFLGGLFLIALLYFAFESKRWKKIGKGILALSVSGVAAIFYFAVQPGNLVYQIFTELATKARLLIWQSAWQSFLEKPWFGWGPENFEIAFPLHFDPRLFVPEYGGEVWFDRAHNIVMDNLVALGIVGSIFYFLVFIAAFYILCRLYFSKKIDFITTAVPVAAFIAYFLQNLTVFDMVSSLMLFFLILGFIASAENEVKDEEEDMIVQNRTIKPAVAVPVFLVAFFFCFFKFIVFPAQNGTLAVQAINYQELKTDQRIEAYKKTLAISPIGKYQIVDFFCESFDEYSLSSAAVTVPNSQLVKEFSYLAEEVKKNIDSSPLDFRAYLKLGQFYNSWARIDASKAGDAVDILEKAMKLSSTNQQTYWAMAQAKFIQGKPDEAMALADAAIKLEPRVENSHFIAMRIALIEKDQALFEKKMNEALAINPDWKKDIVATFGQSGN